MFSTGQHQLCMPTGQHQLCMLRTISNRIRIEYIWLQHMIQVRILGNNKGARHPQDLRQWPLSFLLCQTPAFLQQSFFPTKVCFPHQLPLDMIDCWYGPVRHCYISCHGSLHRSASHSRYLYWFHLQESTSPPKIIRYSESFFWWNQSTG